MRGTFSASRNKILATIINEIGLFFRSATESAVGKLLFQPFNAPAVIPSIINLCMNTYRITIGVEIIHIAQAN